MAKGNVLEIGFGSGLNLAFYDPAKVQHVWGLEPSEAMLKLATKRLKETDLSVKLLKSTAEENSLDENSVDTIVITYTLCSIPDALTALNSMHRVLKPHGRLLFCEHGAAPDPNVRRWQDLINPIWKRIGGGCHLNRQIPLMLEQSGFKIQQIETMYIPGWKPASFNYWGTATPE